MPIRLLLLGALSILLAGCHSSACTGVPRDDDGWVVADWDDETEFYERREDVAVPTPVPVPVGRPAPAQPTTYAPAPLPSATPRPRYGTRTAPPPPPPPPAWPMDRSRWAGAGYSFVNRR